MMKRQKLHETLKLIRYEGEEKIRRGKIVKEKRISRRDRLSHFITMGEPEIIS